MQFKKRGNSHLEVGEGWVAVMGREAGRYSPYQMRKLLVSVGRGSWNAWVNDAEKYIHLGPQQALNWEELLEEANPPESGGISVGE